MKVTHRVHNSENETVGFLIEQQFYNCKTITENIKKIDNLQLLKTGTLKAKRYANIQDITLLQYNKLRLEELNKNAPFVRDSAQSFLVWKKNYSSKQLLYLKGSRQVGKTTELLKFAYANYEYVIYVNLADASVLKLFLQYVVTNPGSLLFGMSYFCEALGLPEYKDSSRTILILDEIQVSAEIFNSLRTLLNNLQCNIAVTGSYLGAVLKPEFFQPAGNTFDVTLQPLSFREFCRVFDKEEEFVNISIVGKSEKSSYECLTKLYQLYLEIGGFPRVVQEYKVSSSIMMCMHVLNSLMLRFTEESVSYFPQSFSAKASLVFSNVYKAAAIMQLQEKKGTGKLLTEFVTDFVKADTKCPVTRKEVNDSVTWLYQNGLLGDCDLYNQGNRTNILFGRRYYFTDTGILNCILETVTAPNADKQGLKAETFVFNELNRLCNRSSRLVVQDKPIFALYNNYELDFVLFDKDDKVWGVEVKSNKQSSPKSLEAFKQAGLIDNAVVAEITKGGVGARYRSIPIYTVGEKFPYVEVY